MRFRKKIERYRSSQTHTHTFVAANIILIDCLPLFVHKASYACLKNRENETFFDRKNEKFTNEIKHETHIVYNQYPYY